MRLVQFGTFDVENYGDLLFPLIALHRLGAVGGEVTFASPVGGSPVWADCVPTVQSSSLIDDELDGIILGGGNIVHAGQAGVDAYRCTGLSTLLAYTRLWLKPSELASVHGVPLCWNAPGVPQTMTPRAADVLRWAAGQARYLSVRDSPSLRNLHHAGVVGPIEVVPDPGLEVAELWTDAELAQAREALFVKGTRSIPERTIVFHTNDRYIAEPLESVAERLDRVSERLQATPVLLALGPCHGDDTLARAIGTRMRSDPVVVDRPASLRQVVAAIAGAELYVGSSLHGMITSLAFGRPGVLVAREGARGGKFSGFLSQFQLQRWHVPSWAEAEGRVDEVLGADPAHATGVWPAARPLLDAHWERMADMLQTQPRPSRSETASGPAPSLDGIIEEGIEALLTAAEEERRRAAAASARADSALRQPAKAEREDRSAAVEKRFAEIEATLRATVTQREEMFRAAMEAHAVASHALAGLQAELVETQARYADAQAVARRLEIVEPQRQEARAELKEARRLLRSREKALRRVTDALEQARTEQKVVEQQLRTVENGVAEAERARGDLSAEIDRMSTEIEGIRSAKNESLERERALRNQFVLERDSLEERLEATLAALNEARLTSTARLEIEPLEAERDKLRAQLLRETAARQGLEQHLAALRQEIEERVRPARDATRHAVATARSAPPPPAKTDPFPSSSDAEVVAGAGLFARYSDLCRESGLDQLPDQGRALPWPVFPRVPEGHWVPRASIIICVHNALHDVRPCLDSVARHLPLDAEIVLVDDGSGPETAEFLRLVQDGRRVRLIGNPTPPHGYPIAANLGLRGALGEYLVLLNSDTIVTADWLERLIACAESDRRIGFAGPVSNAASHQSVPKVREGGAWANNPLPEWLTVDGMAVAVASVSPIERPRVPFVNGYCYMITRHALDAVGYLDEENFSCGYCEENDFSVRARAEGFTGAIADDAFVFHAKSRSYTPEGRNQHARRSYARFLEKHGAERIQQLVDVLESAPPVDKLGRRLGHVLADQATLVRGVHECLGAPVRPLFVLSGVAEGGSGGSHSIVQEVAEMRRVGVPAQIAISDKAAARARAAYPDALDHFRPYRGAKALAELASDAHVLVATHSGSVGLVSEALSHQPALQTAYYVQDYEPFFWEEGSEQSRSALASYTQLAGAILFAKTHWLCNVVSAAHGVRVHKVEPSLDRSIYHPGERLPDESAPVIVAAMVRPRTPRRQPQATVRLLERLMGTYGDQVKVVTFGCPSEAFQQLTDMPALREGHQGMVSRTEVAQLLRRAEVFVDHSMYQAFGRTALEAMACGCVPVVPSIGGAWEFAEPGVNALVCDTLDEDSVYSSVSQLIEEPQFRNQLRETGLGTAARYSVERAAMSEFALFASRLLFRQQAGDAKGLAARVG